MLEYLLDGGPLMIPLLGVSALVLAVIIDRARAFRMASVDTTELRQRVIDMVQKDKLDEAIAECEQSQGPVASILLAGLRKYKMLKTHGWNVADIEGNVIRTMDDYAPHVLDALEKRLNLLSLSAGIAPLLGFTGTVTGMIAAFGAMAAASGLEGADVAGGISQALITTAAGLLIAIPAVIFHNIYSRRIDRFILDIEETATELIDVVTLSKKSS